MRTRLSVTLDSDLLATIDKHTQDGESRSRLIERVLREFVVARERDSAYAADLAILNRHAESLNAEAADVLEYQADPWGD